MRTIYSVEVDTGKGFESHYETEDEAEAIRDFHEHCKMSLMSGYLSSGAPVRLTARFVE